ncbi:MAG: hypothetical protein WC881_10975, partial [Elusimicrobiota bacterium]
MVKRLHALLSYTLIISMLGSLPGGQVVAAQAAAPKAAPIRSVGAAAPHPAGVRLDIPNAGIGLSPIRTDALAAPRTAIPKLADLRPLSPVTNSLPTRSETSVDAPAAAAPSLPGQAESVHAQLAVLAEDVSARPETMSAPLDTNARLDRFFSAATGSNVLPAEGPWTLAWQGLQARLGLGRTVTQADLPSLRGLAEDQSRPLAQRRRAVDSIAASGSPQTADLLRGIGRTARPA